MLSWLVWSAVFSYKNLVHAVAGGVGNAVAIAVCYPLECARTRVQIDDKVKPKYSLYVIHDIYKEEGICGVYRGLKSLALCLYWSSFVYFFVFRGLKSALDEAGHEQDFLTDLKFGTVAGIFSVFFSNPLWVINTRLKLQGAKLKTDTYKELKHPPYNGLRDCLVKVVRYDGVAELWSGTVMSLLLVSNPAVQFMVYEGLKRVTQALLNTVVLGGLYYFLFGAISKMMATFVTYPLQLIQTRIRAGYTGKAVFNPNGSATKFEVFLSLYRGLESKLSQTILTAALMLLTYEEIAHFVCAVMGLDNNDKKDG